MRAAARILTVGALAALGVVMGCARSRAAVDHPIIRADRARAGDAVARNEEWYFFKRNVGSLPGSLYGSCCNGAVRKVCRPGGHDPSSRGHGSPVRAFPLG